jgi:signal transduction histidine kinase
VAGIETDLGVLLAAVVVLAWLGWLVQHKTTALVKERGQLERQAVQLEASTSRLEEARRALTQNEERYNDLLKSAAVGQLAGGAAHDFNNLLTVISVYSGLVLSELPADSGQRAEVQEIADAAKQASELTRQLLALSRAQTLDLRDPAGTALLRATVEQIVKQAGGRIQTTDQPGEGTTLTVHIPEAPQRSTAA